MQASYLEAVSLEVFLSLGTCKPLTSQTTPAVVNDTLQPPQSGISTYAACQKGVYLEAVLLEVLLFLGVLDLLHTFRTRPAVVNGILQPQQTGLSM